MYTPVNPSFTIQKWGSRGSTLYRHVLVMFFVQTSENFFFPILACFWCFGEAGVRNCGICWGASLYIFLYVMFIFFIVSFSSLFLFLSWEGCAVWLWPFLGVFTHMFRGSICPYDICTGINTPRSDRYESWKSVQYVCYAVPADCSQIAHTCTNIQSTLVISNPKDSMKYFEISAPRHIRFAELWKK